MKTLFLLFLSLLPLAAQSSPTTTVLATLSVKPGHTREEVMKHMPAEIRATAKLYLEGKITQWYSKADGRGVVFFVNATSVEDAKAILDTLPLIKENIAQFDYVPLSPLTPLRLLIN